MYKAFLSFAQLREYLTMLVEKGLIEYEEGTARFRTTEKGLKMLQMCNEINEELTISPMQTRELF